MLITRKDKLAEETLSALRPMLSRINPGYAYITPYENCREVGHVLHVSAILKETLFEREWTFSENRNSDQVVVYMGDFMKALLMSGMSKKTEKAADAMYDSRRYFSSPEKAAAFIARSVRASLKNSKVKAS